MVLGIGVDIVKVQRFNSWIQNRKLVERFFSAEEVKILDSKVGVAQSLASRFAAKEAFGKALGTGIRNFELKEVEVKKDSLGKPFLQVSGAAKKLCETVGVEKIHLSISHEKEYAVAFIVLETA